MFSPTPQNWKKTAVERNSECSPAEGATDVNLLNVLVEEVRGDVCKKRTLGTLVELESKNHTTKSFVPEDYVYNYAAMSRNYSVTANYVYVHSYVVLIRRDEQLEPEARRLRSFLDFV